MNFLRNKYWLICGKQSIKSSLKNYVTCKHINGKTVIPPETISLPKSRVDYSYPYQNFGLDYAGPIYYKSAGNSKRKMSKGLIITCCCTRAVHIEFTPDLSIKSFLLAFRLSISRCGVPENIISDNFKTFKSKEIRNFMRYLRVKWNFILEKSLWLGGFYEGMARILKNALKKVVGRTSLDRDQLNTVLIEIENIINSRPLTYISEEHFEESLIPCYLIYGRNIAVN